VVPGGPGAVAGTVSKALELAGCNGEDSLETSKPYGQKAKHLDIIQKQDPSKKHFLLTFFVPKSARKRRHATQGDKNTPKIQRKWPDLYEKQTIGQSKSSQNRMFCGWLN
jgi:hypothetical protein